MSVFLFQTHTSVFLFCFFNPTPLKVWVGLGKERIGKVWGKVTVKFNVRTCSKLGKRCDHGLKTLTVETEAVMVFLLYSSHALLTHITTPTFSPCCLCGSIITSH